MKTLDLIYRELRSLGDESDYSQEIFDLVDKLIVELGEDNIANKVHELTSDDEPIEYVAHVLAIMIWSTSDNGTAIMKSAEQWIRDCSDERKIYTSLHLDVYPFIKHSDMVHYFAFVSDCFPTLKKQCDSLLTSRKD